jgi:hypothetical protein
MANFMTSPTTAKTQVSGSDIVIGTDNMMASSLIFALKRRAARLRPRPRPGCRPEPMPRIRWYS